MSDHLVLSAMSHDRPGIVDELTSWVASHQGNIEDSRMAILGGEFAVIMLISGAPNAIDTLAHEAEPTWTPKGIHIHSKITTRDGVESRQRKAVITVTGLDHPGIISDIARFFSTRQINIASMETHTSKAAHTGSPMITVGLQATLGVEVDIEQLRETFVEHCDQLNLDATLFVSDK